MRSPESIRVVSWRTAAVLRLLAATAGRHERRSALAYSNCAPADDLERLLMSSFLAGHDYLRMSTWMRDTGHKLSLDDNYNLDGNLDGNLGGNLELITMITNLDEDHGLG